MQHQRQQQQPARVEVDRHSRLAVDAAHGGQDEGAGTGWRALALRLDLHTSAGGQALQTAWPGAVTDGRAHTSAEGHRQLQCAMIMHTTCGCGTAHG
jgi:hypothetical protein